MQQNALKSFTFTLGEHKEKFLIRLLLLSNDRQMAILFRCGNCQWMGSLDSNVSNCKQL